MRFKRSTFNLAAIVFAVLGGASTAWAGIAVVPVQSAPTLGGWVLILLALLFVVVAYRALRARANGSRR